MHKLDVSSYSPIPHWLSEEGLKTLQRGYLLPGETPKDLYARVAYTASKYLKRPDLQQDFFDILYKGFLGLATPVASNFGTKRGLPISCFSTSIGDSLPSIYSHLQEAAMLSKVGGGVGVYYGNVRPGGTPIKNGSGGTSNSIVDWATQYDKCASTVNQGGVRRGAFAHYLPIEHPDAYELMLAKDHLEGDPRKMIDGNIAFTVTDAFIYKVLAGDKDAKRVWSKALETNLKTGSPYFIFIDNVNRQNPEAYKMRGLEVETSNLCSEILLYTDDLHSFVCCLSSLNLTRWFEWKDWIGDSGLGVIELSIYLLDAVLSEFIKRAKNDVTILDKDDRKEQRDILMRAIRSADKGRALGLGCMGLHYLYQSQGLPFKSKGARKLNIEIHKEIYEKAKKASRKMAEEYGEPEWCEGTGTRHTHVTAIAPTRTNSVISGAYSAGIEPIDSNIFTAKQAKGSFIRKNPLLVKLLEDKGINTAEVWDSILNKNGSVLHLKELTFEEKHIFLTAREIDQEELIRQAADRTPYIDQGQSLNRFVHPNIPADKLGELILKAWKSGVKSTYYTKSSSESVLRKVQNEAHIITKDGCPYCDKTKELFKENNISYTEYKREDLDTFEWKTVPQIWYQNHHVGGFNDLVKYVSSLNNDPIQQLDRSGVNPPVFVADEEDKYNECSACEA